MDKFRAVAMDGGSTVANGFVTAALLQGIEAEVRVRTGSGFLDEVYLFSGTSAGAFNAAVLAKFEKPADALPHILDFWEHVMDAENPIGAISPCRVVGALTGQAAFLSTKKLQEFFQDYFGELRLGDLKHNVTINTFHLDNHNPLLRTWKPKIFNNLNPNDPDCAVKIADVLMRSGSPPLLNPIYQGYVDGGIVANNPAMISLAQVLREIQPEDGNPLPLEKILMLSIGNARVPKYLATKSVDDVTDWGYAKWLLDLSDPLVLLDMFLDSGTQTVNYECRRLLGERFFRIDPFLSKSLGVTKGSEVLPAVRKFMADPVTQEDLKAAARWLQAIGWIPKAASDSEKS